MLKRPQYMSLGVVVALALVMLNLPGPTAARLKLAIGGLFLPLFGLAGAGQQTAGQLADAALPRAELARRIESLRRENQQLRIQATQAAEVLQENERLRQQIGWRQHLQPWKPRFARVLLRDPANWWRTVQIDLGRRDGLRENLPVLSPEGYLVGRTAAVSLLRSQVVLIGNPDCKVGARVQNDARDTGVLGAGGPFDNSLLTLSYLSRNAGLKPGQNVVTSGLGGIFPAGIPIGKIVDSRPVEYGYYLEARVKPAANLGALEEVWVLMP
jgi:rod shape-determining protein MreC